MNSCIKVKINGFKKISFRDSSDEILSKKQKKNCAENVVKSALERNGIEVGSISVEGYY